MTEEEEEEEDEDSFRSNPKRKRSGRVQEGGDGHGIDHQTSVGFLPKRKTHEMA